jgi:hypothetical protein
MRVVQVRVTRPEFADTLGAMREWLDRHSRPLVRFETAADENAIIVKVQFDADDLAHMFRRDFNGDYDGDAAKDPGEVPYPARRSRA